ASRNQASHKLGAEGDLGPLRQAGRHRAVPWSPTKAPAAMIAWPQPQQVMDRTGGGFTAPGVVPQGLPAPDSHRGWANGPLNPANSRTPSRRPGGPDNLQWDKSQNPNPVTDLRRKGSQPARRSMGGHSYPRGAG